MKITYAPAEGQNVGPRYYFQPENHHEQKVLTILRDVMLLHGNRLRMIGAEHSEKKVANMPAKPVIQAAFAIEDAKGECPESFRPSGADKLDPDRHVERAEQSRTPVNSVSMDGQGNMRVVRQGDTTVIEERKTR